GLIDRGVGVGDRVAILAENSPEWLMADIAVLAAGAADVPVHAPSAPAQVEYQLRHSGARAVIVSNQPQADKVFQVAAYLPDVELVVSFAPITVPAGIKAAYLSWDGLLHQGWRHGSFGAGLVGKREASVGPGDLATIIYTSGTTGPPKGVMLTHGNLISNTE